MAKVDLGQVTDIPVTIQKNVNVDGDIVLFNNGTRVLYIYWYSGTPIANGSTIMTLDAPYRPSHICNLFMYGPQVSSASSPMVDAKWDIVQYNFAVNGEVKIYGTSDFLYNPSCIGFLVLD